jgi:hypothetical protein
MMNLLSDLVVAGEGERRRVRAIVLVCVVRGLRMEIGTMKMMKMGKGKGERWRLGIRLYTGARTGKWKWMEKVEMNLENGRSKWTGKGKKAKERGHLSRKGR